MGGTGIKQLRENIAESKLSYKIMDNIHKYFYLITFCAYLRECARSAVGGTSDEEKKDFSLTGGKVSAPTEKLKLAKTFVKYMEEHSNLRTIWLIWKILPIPISMPIWAKLFTISI